MFKLLYLSVSGHPQLGTVELPMIELNKANNDKQPYTTVIIGANGTGKSFILRTIAEIFRELKNLPESKEKDFRFPSTFRLRYQLYNNIYEVVYEKTDGKRKLLFYKNRPWEKEFNVKNFTTGYSAPRSGIEYPDNLIVSSTMLNDRFVFAENNPDVFYQYLGVRRTRSTTSTQTFSKKVIRYLFDAKKSDSFTNDFSNMLNFMGFEKYFKVHYHPKYHSLFFSGNLKLEQFRGFYQKWWESGHTKRKETNRPWGLWYYEKLEKENPLRLQLLVDFLNNIAKNECKLLNKPYSRAKKIEIDFFSSENSTEEYDCIEDLVKLDILNLDGIKIKKKETEFSIEQSSSGEYHLLISLLGLYSKIEQASLILIDEPEISLHPNWQMRYINFLKKMFRKHTGCHFVLTTHSHFLVSGLEGDSSSVLTLNRDTETNILYSELLEGKDTYGWSAEEILYRVFKVRTTRNYYLELELRELLHKIAMKSDDTKRMNEILATIKKMKFSGDDPMNLIIEKAEKYLNK